MRSVHLARPHRFRFTEEADIKAYGDAWYVYDEAKIVRLPARQLMLLEAEIGQPITSVIDGFRADTVAGRLAGTWIALRLTDPDIAGPYEAFSPIVLLLDFEQIDVSATEAMQAPLDPSPTADSPTSPSTV